jgi:signal transduction histidine kinase
MDEQKNSDIHGASQVQKRERRTRSPDPAIAGAADFANAPAFGTVAGLLPDGLLLLNRQRRIVYANPAFLALAGTDSVAQVLGLTTGAALACCQDAVTSAGRVCGTRPVCQFCGTMASFLDAQRDGQPPRASHIVTGPQVGARELSVRAQRLVWQGKPLTLTLLRDVSAEGRRVFLERLFFHDVTNLILSLQGALHLQAAGLAPPACKDAETPLQLVEHLLDEISAQHDLAAAERSELQPRRQAAEAVSLIHDVAALQRRHPSARGREIVLTPSEVRVPFESDPTLLRRVLGNMVRNALEAEPPGARVTLGCGLDSAGVVFHVHNPGVMPPEVQHQIFRRSFSTKGTGRGLGTYSMKLLTERYLGGAIGFTSDASSGTIFVAHYPLRLPRTGETTPHATANGLRRFSQIAPEDLPPPPATGTAQKP